MVLMKAFEFLLSNARDASVWDQKKKKKDDVLKSRSGRKKDLMILSNMSGRGHKGFVVFVVWH